MEGGREIAVVGLGNVLHGDDGVGPYAVRVLEAHWDFPDDVRVVDLGTPGLDLHPHVAGLDALIVVDTVRAEGEPGELRRYDMRQILRHPPPIRVSPHDPGLKETLLSLEFAGLAPREVVLLGVVPRSCEQGIGLDPAVRDAVPRIERAVVEELGRLGRAPARREPPVAPDIWWEWGGAALSPVP